MTFDERVQAVAKKGFTGRQARFLTTVMLHAGVCVPRQYARFCGIVHGEKTRKFFAKLVRLGFASMYDCRHNRARVYHLNQRALYSTISEADSRLRKPVTLNHAIHRLMLLDAIVEDPDMVWLGTSEEKALHLTTLLRIESGDLPHVVVGQGDAKTVRYFPDPSADRHSSIRPRCPRLRHRRPVARRVPHVSRSACGAPSRASGMDAPDGRAATVSRHRPAGQTDRWNQLMTPLNAEILDEARWYFEQARAHPAPTPCPDLDARFYRARAAFSTPRFKALYRVWKEGGEAAFASCTSHALEDAVSAGAGRVEPLELATGTVISHPGRSCLSHASRRTLAAEQAMTHKVEAIYSGAVFMPTRKLDLRDKQLVRLTVETIGKPERDRDAAVAR